MRIIEMRPEITPHKVTGKVRKVGNWSYKDEWDDEGTARLRHVWHYSTRMLTYISNDNGYEADPWDVIPLSIGHGSVSDQQGMNDLMGFRYYWVPVKGGPSRRVFTSEYPSRYVYRRDGGVARIERLPDDINDERTVVL